MNLAFDRIQVYVCWWLLNGNPAFIPNEWANNRKQHSSLNKLESQSSASAIAEMILFIGNCRMLRTFSTIETQYQTLNSKCFETESASFWPTHTQFHLEPFVPKQTSIVRDVGTNFNLTFHFAGQKTSISTTFWSGVIFWRVIDRILY